MGLIHMLAAGRYPANTRKARVVDAAMIGPAKNPVKPRGLGRAVLLAVAGLLAVSLAGAALSLLDRARS